VALSETHDHGLFVGHVGRAEDGGIDVYGFFGGNEGSDPR